MDIKVLKLVNGDEIICGVEYKDNTVVIDHPARIMLMQSEDGGVGCSLIPWFFHSSQTQYPIQKSHIIIDVDPQEELRNAYSEQFGSGIVTPPSGLIL
jgi:hypothetical protein